MTFFIFLLSSCHREYNKEVCQDLSFRAFKGVPQAAHDFQRHCQEITIEYDHQRCQQALNDLIISASLVRTLERHGEEAKGCFSQNDLNTFVKDY